MTVEQSLIALLLTRVSELESQVSLLSYSPSYQVLTRAAVERKWRQLNLTNKSILYFDIDNLHKQNELHGHTEMNRRISEGLNSIRQSELLGLVFSGDEFVAVVPNDEAQLTARRLSQSFRDVGVTVTVGVSEIVGADFDSNYKRMSNLVAINKSNGKRDCIVVI